MNLHMEYWNGMRVIITPENTEIHYQARLPRSKKKRIRRKWAKVESNYKTTHRAIIFGQGGNKTIILHPEDYQKIKMAGDIK